MNKKFQRVTIIIASDDLGGDHPCPPLDILCDLIVNSPDVDIISIRDVRGMNLVSEE